MKIGIVGGGYSAILAALFIKQMHKNYDVLIFEKNDCLGKKIKATGNGKCNINTYEENNEAFNQNNIIKEYFSNYTIKEQINALNSLGLYLKTLNGNGLYPISESANNVVEILKQQLFYNNVIIHLETHVIDYKLQDNQISLLTNKGIYLLDKLIIATGGNSSFNLGSDGNFVETIKKHGYQFKKFRPGLCPIVVKENVKSLFGQRIKANVQLIKNNEVVYQEAGEVNFKKDGLSGIVIMNIASVIARSEQSQYKIIISPINKLIEEEFTFLNRTLPNPLLSYANKEIAEYVFKVCGIIPKCNLKEQEINKLVFTFNNLTFNFVKLYDFKDSQVSIGGVMLNNLDLSKMSSKIEKNVYFIGETVDIDGLCGGYNMKWCLLSALKLKDNI